MKKFIILLPLLLSLLTACEVFSGVIDDRWGNIVKKPRIIVSSNDRFIYISDDQGDTWQTIIPPFAFTRIVSSSDHMKLAAITFLGIFTSSDGGITWLQGNAGGATGFQDIAISGDGSKIFVTQLTGYLYSSTDGGILFSTDSSLSNTYAAIAMTPDWTKGVRTIGGGSVSYYASYNGTWADSVVTFPSISSQGIAMSTDGMRMYVTDIYNGVINLSTNGGTNWTQVPVGATAGSWFIACSDDGIKVALTGGNFASSAFGYIWTSTNGGATWTPQIASGLHVWGALASSSDGKLLVAGCADNAYKGPICISKDAGVTWREETSFGNFYTRSIAIK
jgi:hypothetical protein